MMDNKKLWDSVLVELELGLSKANFNTWFKDTFIAKQDDGAVVLSVPNAFVKDWLLNKYHKNILKLLRGLSENIRSVDYLICKDDYKKKEPENTSLSVKNVNVELPLNDFYVDKETNLNPRYNFDSFIIGPFNELAHAAAQAIIKNPGRVYNPFFVYGDTGRGKTHLIQAVGNHIKMNFPSLKIYYMTSEKFTVDYFNCLQMNKMGYFKEKYRKYDVLIMDDIQFFSSKEKSQEEFFHLFNSLHENGKQIIFSSDKHPNFIPNLEDRIKSRFSAGMIVDIPAPDQESRAAILRHKAKNLNFQLQDDVVDYLSSVVEGNIRELEGVLNSIVCQAQLKGRDLVVSEIKNLIKNCEKPKRAVSVKEVVKAVANFYNIEEEVVYEKTRRKEVVKPRQITMYILREDYNVSYPAIGQKLGGRDHTTVIHSYEKVKNDLKNDHVLEQELNQIRLMI